ncbi:hypothetical protein PO461_11940 [Enterobacter asburiae]|uniref:hypothetical protein n=1 Tax=Enterobacter asburiae TaxID=61645 RepID=UPI002FFD457B
MSTITSDMLTLRHFIDRPTWAAAAGYDFNFLDCMAYTADLYCLVLSTLRSICAEFPYTEVRELPLGLVNLFVSIALSITWPLVFWIIAIPVWLKCRRERRRYQFGGEMTEVAIVKLEHWQHECERKWRRNP